MTSLTKFVPTYGFFVGHIVDLAIYVIFIRTPNPSAIQAFLTTPLRPHENYRNAYPSPEVVYIYNFWAVLAFILLIDIYMRLLRPSRLKVNPATLAFGTSIAVSYIQSGLLWKSIDIPSAGTSIIGSCMVLTMIAFAGRDLFREGNQRSRDSDPTPAPLIPIVFIVVFGAIYLAEYINNGSVVAHLLGDALFMPVFALLLAAESPSAKVSGTWAGYVFAAVVSLIVVLFAFPVFAPLAFSPG